MTEICLLEEVNQLALNEDQLKEIREQDANGQPITLIGIIQRADAENQNKRVYPYNILKKECDNYKENFVNKKLALGELDHEDDSTIKLKNVSHVLEDLWWGGPDEKEVYGKIRLLSTPAGKIAKQIVLDGIPLGISSRAVGSISKNEIKGTDVVGEDLQLICWDLVSHPSTHNAFMKLNEGKKILKDFDPKKILPPELRIKNALKEFLGK